MKKWLLAWFFIMSINDGPNRFVGPFETEADCKEARILMIEGFAELGTITAYGCKVAK